MDQRDKISLTWNEEGKQLPFEVKDDNHNGLIDGITWTVPHLSTQTFTIILLSGAEHLDASRAFIEDVYAQVSALDGVWKSIPNLDYVRVTFEKELGFFNDITVYAKGKGDIEVYEVGGTQKIADIAIDGEGEYKTYLTALGGRTQNTFDLKIIGDIAFDYIVDPTAVPGGSPELRAQG